MVVVGWEGCVDVGVAERSDAASGLTAGLLRWVPRG